MARWARLSDRGVLEITGADARKLLQGLVSSDLDRLEAEPAIYAALLTPQGKYLFDFLIFAVDEALWLDVEAARLDDLVRRLTLYRLRADAQFRPRADLAVFVVFDGSADVGSAAAIGAPDPRLDALGQRLIGEPAALEPVLDEAADRASADDWDRHRLRLGVPDGSRDLEPDKALLLENGFVELRGVDFDKGCFVGQELTARMRYRSTVRKRLLPATVRGRAEPGTTIRDGELEVGELRSVRGEQALALIRLDRWEQARAAGRPLQAGDAAVEPRVADWIDLTFASKRAESSA